MTYLNLNVNDLRGPEFVGEEPANRGVWLSLLSYCVSLENSGVIAGAGRWKSRMWEQSCGVTEAEAKAESALWQWKGDDMHVWGYPLNSQELVQKRRENGKKGGRPANPAAPSVPNQGGNHDENHVGNLMVNHPGDSVNPNGTEGNGKKTEGNETERAGADGRSAPLPSSDISSSDPVTGTPGALPPDKTPKTKKKEGAADAGPMPEVWTPDQRLAFGDWLAYKIERKEPYKPRGIAALIKKLSPLTPTQMVACINDSMSNNWAGLFPENFGANDPTLPLGQKKEGAAAGASKEPEFPWRRVASGALSFEIADDTLWAQLSGDTRSEIRRAWTEATGAQKKEWGAAA